jgi:inositol-hexakisphosphate/diphosphoinositol-pentakisphosphate 1-kinase
MLMHRVCCFRVYRVKLPKTFLAVNLSDAFTFQEKPQNSEGEGDVLEMKSGEHEHKAALDPPEPDDED